VTVRKDIIQAGRTWAKDALGLTDSDVIPAYDDGPRPEIPYLMINAGPQAVPYGHADKLYDTDSGIPRETIEQAYATTLSVNGYGEATSDWLADMHLSLAQTSTQQLLADEKIGVTQESETRDLSALTDTEIEFRFQRDFEARFVLELPPADLVEASTLQLDVDLIRYENDPETLSTTATASI